MRARHLRLVLLWAVARSEAAVGRSGKGRQEAGARWRRGGEVRSFTAAAEGASTAESADCRDEDWSGGREGGTPRHAAGGRQLRSRWRHWRESRYENETAKISLLKNKDSLVLLNARFDPDNLENGETDGWTADVEIALDVDPLSNLDAFAQSSYEFILSSLEDIGGP